MKDFKYHQKAAEFDDHLEKVMESHAAASTAQAPAATPPEPTKQSGLQSYIDGVTIHDEVQAILSRPKTASEEIRTELARDRMDEILDSRESLVSSFVAETKVACEELAQTPDQRTLA